MLVAGWRRWTWIYLQPAKSVPHVQSVLLQWASPVSSRHPHQDDWSGGPDRVYQRAGQWAGMEWNLGAQLPQPDDKHHREDYRSWRCTSGCQVLRLHL